MPAMQPEDCIGAPTRRGRDAAVAANRIDGVVGPGAPNDGPPMTTITPEHHRRLAELAPAAIERLEAFGYRERIECAGVLICAGLSPLWCLIALDWPPNVVAVVLCIDISIALAGDWLCVVFAPNALAAISRTAAHDEFVFRVAEAISIGRTWVPSKLTPSLAELDEPGHAAAALVFGPIGLAMPAFSAWLIMVDTELHAVPATLVVGVLPTALLVTGA